MNPRSVVKFSNENNIKYKWIKQIFGSDLKKKLSEIEEKKNYLRIR